MTIESVSWARERHVPGDAGRVLEALANYANHRTGEIQYEPEWIAEDACITASALPRYLGALRRNKLILREEKGKEKRYWLNIEPDQIIPAWSWDAAESATECDEAPSPRLAPPVAPARFQKAAQAEQRKEFSAAPPGQPADKHPIVTGSKLDEEWTRWFRANRKLRPFEMCIILKNGSQARGYYMPSAVPPKEQEQIAV